MIIKAVSCKGSSSNVVPLTKLTSALFAIASAPGFVSNISNNDEMDGLLGVWLSG